MSPSAPSLPHRALQGCGRLGAAPRKFLQGLGSAAWLAGLAFRQLLRLRMDQVGVVAEQTLLQVRFTALQALPLTLLAALLLGGITLLQVFGQLSSFGAEAYLSQLLARLVIRELGPLLVGIIVIARSGTAIAAEMASIQLSGEVDALSATGVDPVQFLLVPRVLGGMISVFTLVVFFDAAALLGGFAVAALRVELSLPFFLEALGQALGGRELAITAAKALLFGALVPLLCAGFGLRVGRSSTEIPQAVTRAAVISLVSVLLASAFLSVALYG
ncbi:MAG TPA: ABC transporter permease [Holophaga sp.]|nr:ABC transporter permease [Holophaga sp.]